MSVLPRIVGPASVFWALGVAVGLWGSRAYAEDRYDGMVISEVRITGNVEASDRAIRKLVATRATSWLRKRRFKEKVFERDLQAIVISYQNSGYLSASVVDHRLEVSPADTTLKITVRLSEGPRYRVGRVLLDGNSALPDSLLVGQLLLNEGLPFERLHLDDDLARLQVLYAEHGMVDAQIEQRVDFDHQEATADIAYTISEGLVVHIGRVNIEGNQRVRRGTVERELTFSPGTRYNHLKTIQSQANLFRTGFFSQVGISLARTAPEASVRDVSVRVEERKTGEVDLGVGYGTLDRARLSVRAVQKCLRGSGVGVGFEGKLGKLERTARASMTTQWVLGWRVGMDAYAFYAYVEQPAYTTEELGTQLDTRRRLTTWNSLTAGASVTRTVLLEGDAPQREGRTNAVQVELVRDTRNDVLSPVRGVLHRLRVQWAGGPLGGDYAFLKVQANTSRSVQLSGRWVVASSVRLGRITPQRGGGIPVHERFFAGGANSLRGFDSGSIGADLETAGGMVLVSVQNEVRFPLWPSKRVGGTLLGDLGQTWLTGRDVTVGDMQVGVGAGVRMGSPFGPVRFDVAAPAAKALAWKRVQVYVAIGQAF